MKKLIFAIFILTTLSWSQSKPIPYGLIWGAYGSSTSSGSSDSTNTTFLTWTQGDARFVQKDSSLALKYNVQNNDILYKGSDDSLHGVYISSSGDSLLYRDDSTLFFAGGGSGGWTEISRTADTTHNTIVFADIGELQFTMAASGVYEIEGVFFVARSNNANAFTIGLNLSQAPTSVAIQGWGVNGTASGTDNIKTENIDTYQDSLQLTGATVTVMDKAAWMSGVIVNTGSATLFKMYWHAEVAASNDVLKRGSYIRYRRLY